MITTKEKPKGKVNKLTHFLSKKVGKAITDYKMIQNKDKIVVAVSGGKDSSTLLKMLKYRQSFVPIKFDIMAVHIDFGYSKKNPGLLKRFFEENEIDYRIEKCGEFERLEFSWDGQDENDPDLGRGYVILKEDLMEGKIYFHMSDDSWFKAEKKGNNKL